MKAWSVSFLKFQAFDNQEINMNVKYFGQFLMEKRFITPQQLLDGVRHQRMVNKKMGVLAMDKGYMTSQQLEFILKCQKFEDKTFGELAVAKKFLTHEQVNELLSLQKADRILLGEALVDCGHLTLNQLEKALERYKFEQKEAQYFIASSLGGIHPKYSDIVQQSTNIIQNMLLRLVEERGKVFGCLEKTPRSSQYDYMIYQEFYGEKKCILGMALNAPMILLISSRILRREVTTLDELALDVVKEFINTVLGHICTHLSNQGFQTECMPPRCIKFSEFTPMKSQTEIVVPILMTGDHFEIHYLFP
jgi:CheY-specific phosphatase CheX